MASPDFISSIDSQGSTQPGDHRTLSPSDFAVPRFDITSSPEDEVMLAAAFQAESDMGMEHQGAGHANPSHRDGHLPYDPFTNRDPWQRHDQDDKNAKSPRTALGKGRWDLGPMATVPRPPSPGLSTAASEGSGSASSGLERHAPNFGSHAPPMVSPQPVVHPPAGIAEVPVLYQDLHDAMEKVHSNVRGLISTHAAAAVATAAAANAELNAMLSESFTSGLGDVEQNIMARVAKNEEETKRAHGRLDAHDGRLAALATIPEEQVRITNRLAELERRVDAQNRTMATVQATVATETTTRNQQQASYSRPPNPTILLLNTTQKVKLAAVVDGCRLWLDGIMDREAWTITETTTGQRFTLSFKALARTAVDLTNDAINHLRLLRPGGTWK